MAENISLTDEGGELVSITKKPAEDGIRLVSLPVKRPGLYVWKRIDAGFYYSAVNFPLSESDLRAMTSSEIKKTEIDCIKGGYQVRNLHEGISVWPYLLIAAMAILLMESLLVYKFREP
ncbi:hypothetical protein QUF72_16780 [Desulfobacterales bacterium HSG2]|nr:hypothetical protein [Desulfobacterales bacterium HSG2]